MQTISGIMVDGINIGEGVVFLHADPSSCKKDEQVKGTEHYENFSKADLICINVCDPTGNVLPNDKRNMLRVYPVYSIYGNNVVTSTATESSIANHFAAIKDRLVMVRKKPYILSGVLHKSNSLQNSY